jgi:hypothetical protein
MISNQIFPSSFQHLEGIPGGLIVALAHEALAIAPRDCLRDRARCGPQNYDLKTDFSIIFSVR